MTNSLHTNWAIFFPAFENSTDLFQYLDVPLIVGTYLEVFFVLLTLVSRTISILCKGFVDNYVILIHLYKHQ